eukprot:88720-Chlamydomonas_euryale.AAC.3
MLSFESLAISAASPPSIDAICGTRARARHQQQQRRPSSGGRHGSNNSLAALHSPRAGKPARGCGSKLVLR